MANANIFARVRAQQTAIEEADWLAEPDYDTPEQLMAYWKVRTSQRNEELSL